MTMADETTMDAKLDKIMSHLDGIHSRMDAMEKEQKDSRGRLDAACAQMDSYAKKDAEKEEEAKKADAARKDAEEEEKKKADAARKDAEEEEKKKADAARADAARADAAGRADKLQSQLDALMRAQPAQLSGEARLKMINHQVKAERVAQAFGDAAGAPPPVNGESERDYAVRLMTPYLKYSKKWKDTPLEGINDSVLAAIETDVYADALNETIRPTQFSPGFAIPTRQKDAAGREITRYVGDPNAIWGKFNPPVRHVRRLLTPGSNRVN
jgi:hypothetical protein